MDQQLDLASNVKFTVKDNVLAVSSPDGLATVSSAFFNGGAKRVKHVLNVGVPKGYSDKALHMDPMELITTSAAKLGVTQDYLAMVTAANVHNFSLVTKKTDAYTVAVAATAGCSTRRILRRRNRCTRNHGNHKHHRFRRWGTTGKLHGRCIDYCHRSQVGGAAGF